MEPIESLTLVGAFQGFFLGALLFKKAKSIGQSSIWLSLICISVALTLLDAYLYLSEAYQKAAYLIGIGFPLSLIFCPLVLGYIHHMLRKKLSKKFLWHFGPATISVALLIPFFSLEQDQKLFFLYEGIKPELVDRFFPIIGFAFVIIVSFLQGIIYVYLSFKAIRRYRSELEGFYSSENDVSLQWLKFVVWFMAFIWLLSLTQVFIGSALQLSDELYVVNHSFLVLAMYTLSYFAYEKRNIFQQLICYCTLNNKEQALNTIDEKSVETITSRDFRKYSNSSIDEHLSQMIFAKTKEYMTTSNVFLDSELTLSSLAELLNLPAHHLSQAINQNFNSNFFEFVNHYRVNEAKKYLAQKHDMKILDIAYTCGFNSKSAFYSAFKKAINLTPGQYRKSLGN